MGFAHQLEIERWYVDTATAILTSGGHSPLPELKGKDTMLGRQLFCLMAREYGNKGKEIAGYIQKDPVVVTRYLNEKEGLETQVEKVIEKIKRANFNNQV